MKVAGLLSILPLLALPGCWSEGVALQGQPRPVPPPSVIPAAPGTAGNSAPQTGTPKLPTGPRLRSLLSPMPLEGSADLHFETGDGPMAFMVRQAAPSVAPLPNRAFLHLSLPAGFAVDQPGLGALATKALVETPLSNLGQPSLRKSIRNLGGSLQVEVGPRRTVMLITVPIEEWQKALQSMAQHLQSNQCSRAQFNQLQVQLCKETVDSWQQSPVLGHVSRLIQFGTMHSRELLQILETTDLPELHSYQLQHFQHRGAALGLWLQGEAIAPKKLVQKATEILLPWFSKKEPVADTTGNRTTQRKATGKPNGIYWLPGSAEPEVALILPSSAANPLHMSVEEALSMRGVGGRLEAELQAQLGHPLVFQAFELGNYDQRYLVLRSKVRVEEVSGIWQALQKARTSLEKDPPQSEELRHAKDRVRLRLLAQANHPGEWFEAVPAKMLLGMEGEPQVNLQRLELIDGAQLKQAAIDYGKLPLAMVVIGGKPPKNHNLPLAMLDSDTPVVRTPTVQQLEGQEKLASDLLTLAMSAAGGVEELQRGQGYVSQSNISINGDWTVLQQTWFRSPDRLRQSNLILGSTIESTVWKDQGEESCRGEKIKLPAGQAHQLTAAANRHPIMLLAACARGQSKYQWIGTRQHQGRELAVLERIDGMQARLRIAIDQQSGIIRQVETSEHRQDLGLVHIRETFDDYRQQGPFRVPMRMLTSIEDAAASLETKWSEFTVRQPKPEELQFGGPTGK